MDDKPENNQRSLWELGPAEAVEESAELAEPPAHVEEIFVETKREALAEAAVVTRGTLSMAEVPLELRYRRPFAHQLHVRLERHLDVVDLILTDNRRRMLSSKRSEEHTSELQSRPHLVCRLLLEKKKNINLG